MIIYDSLELNVERKMLTPGLKLVVFELQVARNALIARDFAFLKVEDSALVASIAGGSEVLRSLNKPIILDATSSYDPETGQGILSGMQFHWSCLVGSMYNVSPINFTRTNLSGAINNTSNIFDALVYSSVNQTFFQMPDNIFLHSESGKVTLDTGTLTSNNTYYVLLTIRKDKRTASAMQIVRIQNGLLLNVRIR